MFYALILILRLPIISDVDWRCTGFISICDLEPLVCFEVDAKVRQEAEASLRNETNFRNAMENSTPVGIRAHDMQKRITYVNRAFCEMTGWSANELTGLEPPVPFWPDSRRDEIVDKMNRVRRSEISLKNGIEGAIMRRDGTLCRCVPSSPP